MTASHNPSIYNGYKVYASDGGQVVAPEDAQLVAEVRALDATTVVPRSQDRIRVLDGSWDERFRSMLAGFRLSPHLVAHGSDLPVVYTVAWNRCHRGAAGLEGVWISQRARGGVTGHPRRRLPTVASPNPEEGPALAEAVALAKEVGASLVMGTDPDSDRVGLAVPDGKGDFVLLNGNETAALLTDHVLSKWQESANSTALRLWPRQSSPPTSLSISLNIMGSKSRKP